MLNNQPRFSIIINNYNYARFVKAAIDSALRQTVKPHQIIVVDDGSTDNSLDIIRAYGTAVTLIAKQNGGQASAFNAGFNACTGDWVWFLDADDWLADNAIEQVAKVVDADVAKVHGPLQAVDGNGNLLHFLLPSKPLSAGNVVPELIVDGGYCWPPTSGNIFPRWALAKCLPIPENDYRLCADLYVCNHTVMHGRVQTMKEPVGFYRIHSSNNYHGFRMDTVWLERQASSLLTAASLIEGLVREYGHHQFFTYQFERRNVEMLMIARRFLNGKLPALHSGSALQKKWWNSPEVKTLTGYPRYKGMALWLLLSYAPKPIVRFVIGVQQKKLKRAVDALVPMLIIDSLF